jgi:hypothetical protein
LILRRQAEELDWEDQVTEGAAPEGGKPAKTKGWWGRRSKKAKLLIIAAVLIAIIAAASSSGSKKTDNNNNNSPAPASSSESSDSSSSDTAATTGPLVRGTWDGECNQFSAGDEDACNALRVTKVTCQWQDDHVHMTVVFHNKFGAHVTVYMNPIYKLKNAGLHGDGITATQDVGLDAGEVRTYETDQEPKGVTGTPAITLCRPKVDTLQGVKLG